MPGSDVLLRIFEEWSAAVVARDKVAQREAANRFWELEFHAEQLGLKYPTDPCGHEIVWVSATTSDARVR